MNLFGLILFLHGFMAFLLCIACYPPQGGKTEEIKERNNKRNKIFKKNLPFFTKILLMVWLLIIYWYVYDHFSPLNTLKTLENNNIWFYVVGFSLGYICLFFSTIKKEYSLRDEEMKNLYPKIIYGIIAYIYFFSVFLGMTTIQISNYALDFSQGEEHIVYVTKTNTRVSGGTKSSRIHYEIHYQPDILGVSKIEVPEELQQCVKQGDRLKLFLKKGLFGIPFISGNIKIIKYQ
ncbi:MAG: hypothetical protein II961_06500 [Candidatus Riflebacteria bacterium]|nr:hypothetical protein [Candidatus Riflebacteria bacterium]